MAIGRSLHVGINEVSSAFPNAGILTGPENDARAMQDLADKRGFKSELILGPAATYATIIARLLNAAQEAQPGDIFLFTFAGHGTGEFDPSSEEPDNQDEALLLYDALLFDDELSIKIWPAFKKGVRVLVVADSCHSGSILSLAHTHGTNDGWQILQISQETRNLHLKAYRQFYRQLIVPVFATTEASVLSLSACEDSDTTPDGDPLSLFTAKLLEVMNDQKPTDYRDLIQKIAALVKPHNPQLTPIQPADEAFIGQVPFTI